MPALRSTHWRIQERIFLAYGFAFERQRGDHRMYGKPGIPRPVVIPAWPSVPVDFIMNNMHSAGMSRERYSELLEKL